MAKDKKVVASGVVAPVAGIAAYGIENFLEYLTLKNEYLSSGANPLDMNEFYNFINWNVNGGNWSLDEITNIRDGGMTADLVNKIDYNAALVPNAAVGVASGLVGAIAAAKGNKPAAIMGAGINAATLVNLLYKGTEMMQKSNEAWVREIAGNTYTLYTSQASALPLYIAAMGIEAALLIATIALLAKDARKEYKQVTETLGLQSNFGKKA